MDSTLWKVNGTTNADAAAALGLINFNLTLNNQTPDRLTFNADGRDFDAAELFSYGDAFSLYKGTTRWFEGVVLSGPRFGSPTDERHDYEVGGLWWYLENLVFQQAWRAGTGSLNKSHVILGRDIDNNAVTAGGVIQEALDYAIASGAPFTYSASELSALSAYPPPDEQVDLACSEVVRKMIRWVPDTVAWFDYAPATPVLHFTRRGAAAAVQYDCTGGDPAEELDIRSRADLQRSGVIINYERVDTIDGERIPTLQQDVFPDGTSAGFDTASLTIKIPGESLTTQSADVVVVNPVGDAHYDLIKARRPELESATFDLPTISMDGLPNVLVSGSVPEWSGKTTVSGVLAAVATWTDPNGTVHTKEPVSVVVTLTDAETTKYTREISYTIPDPYPVGLAQALYEALAELHWQGRFQTIEKEVSGSVTPGNVLNLTGALSAWSTMRAVIQSVQFAIDTGRTSITFGPPEHLGPQDHIALLRANRTRITLYSGDSRSTGKASGGDDIENGGGNADSSGAYTQRLSKLVLDDGEVSPAKKIILDVNDIEAGKVMFGKEDAGVKTMSPDYLAWRV